MCHSATQRESKCLLRVPVLPQTTRLTMYLSVCLWEQVCVELRCFMTLHTSRSRFTFYTHILSAGQQLSVSVFAVQFHYPLTD